VTRFGQPFWEEDKQFDLEHHFRHAALPKPGRIRELLAYVSAEHSNLMDRERPLWEAHLIEGLKGRRFALYTKVHHSMMDGMSGMRMLLRTFSEDPADRGIPPLWAVQPRKRSREAAPVQAQNKLAKLADFASEARKQLATLPHVISEVRQSMGKSAKDSPAVSVLDAPQSILNQKITGSRRFAAQSYSLPRIKAISKAFGATVNDVVLAICGAALREYLINQHALPDQPLISVIPVSVRDDDSEGGNEIAMIMANLGTHVADPSTRMEIVMNSVREGKQRFQSMSPQERKLYTALSLIPAGVNMLTGLAPQWQSFNVVISNVPGPKTPLYWNGARMEGIYPVSLLMDKAALNITILSYVDHLEFGLIACRRSLPSMQRLLTYLENAITELEVAANINQDERHKEVMF
ncbi:MAG TPA: wax ester/triacylglycerol synthase family O-acyltransferase, partial [Pseudomonadales bacterium]|nr:wax ester/triacylglycerol synthase family O-acyltransferase [Pseudomonadales bacterium]